MATTPVTTKKVNYLNNRDILKEIHLSKNTYCVYTDPVIDHQYDIILPTLEKINQRTVAEARRNRADRLKREGTIVDPKKIPNTDLVFRITCWEHIPMAPKKVPKSALKKKKIEDILEFDVIEDDPLADLIDEPILDTTRMRVNFPPFEHYRIDENKQPFLVGRSHWRGDFKNGEFSKEHGQMTRKLATMFMKLCERYATRSNWRGYTYNEEMRGQALLQLSQIGLQFDESKSQNPFDGGTSGDVTLDVNLASIFASPTITGTALISAGTVSGNFVVSGTATLSANTSIGNVSSTEIAFLDNVSANVQTQLDNRVNRTDGTVGTATAGSAVVRNITLSTAIPGTATGMDGDVWLQYTP